MEAVNIVNLNQVTRNSYTMVPGKFEIEATANDTLHLSYPYKSTK